MEKRTIDSTTDAFSDFPPELAELFRNARPVTPEMAAEIGEANRALAKDPDFMADCMKGYFVECVLQGLEETGLKKAQLGKRIGKSRQYINKILNEDKRVNFTIETMTQIAHALGRRLDLHVLENHEKAVVFNKMEPRRLKPIHAGAHFVESSYSPAGDNVITRNVA